MYPGGAYGRHHGLGASDDGGAKQPEVERFQVLPLGSPDLLEPTDEPIVGVLHVVGEELLLGNDDPESLEQPLAHQPCFRPGCRNVPSRTHTEPVQWERDLV